MEHIDIEKQIKEIRKSLESELRAANAIDENGRATNKKAFEEIMDRKIHEIEELEPMVTDESGVARDRYSANIYFHNIEILNEMRKHYSIKHEPDSYSLQKGHEKEESLFKKHIFTRGIHKLMSKFTRRPQNQIENEQR